MSLTFLLPSKRDRKYKCIQRDQLKIVWTYFFSHWFMFAKFNKFLKGKMISNRGLRDNWSTVNLKKILRALLFLSFFCRKGWKSRWASVVKNRVCFFWRVMNFVIEIVLSNPLVAGWKSHLITGATLAPVAKSFSNVLSGVTNYSQARLALIFLYELFFFWLREGLTQLVAAESLCWKNLFDEQAKTKMQPCV